MISTSRTTIPTAAAIISLIGSAAKVVSSIFLFTSLIHLMFYNLSMNSSDLFADFYVFFPLVAVFSLNSSDVFMI